MTRSFFGGPEGGKQSLVILGSGWGGYEVLRGVDKKKWSALSLFSRFLILILDTDVTVISPNTYFNFTPLLAGAAVGTLEFRCTVEPVSSERNTSSFTHKFQVRRYTPQVV